MREAVISAKKMTFEFQLFVKVTGVHVFLFQRLREQINQTRSIRGNSTGSRGLTDKRFEGKIGTNLVVYYKIKAKSMKAMIYFHLHLLKNNPIFYQIPFVNRNCCPSKTIGVLMGDNLKINRYSSFQTNPNKEEVVYLRQFLLKKICSS